MRGVSAATRVTIYYVVSVVPRHMHVNDDSIIFLFVVFNPLLGYLARYILSGEGVIYYASPMLYTLWHMLASFIFGFLASASRIYKEPISIVGRICILGVVEAASIVSNNYALSLCSVFTNQSIKACVPLVILVLKLRPSNFRIVHLSVFFAVSAICSLLSAGTLHDTTQGIWLSILSLICVVIRMHLAQHLLLITGVSKAVVLFYQSGAAFLFLLVISASSGTLSTSIKNTTDDAVVIYLIVSAIIAAMYNMIYIFICSRHTALEVSVISTGRQGAVIFASMIKDVRLTFASILLVVQLILSVTWYSFSNEETQGYVQTRLIEARGGHKKAKMVLKFLVCVAAISSMPFLYEFAETHNTQVATLSVSMKCNTSFDGSAKYEIMVSRFDEDNLETLLHAANVLEAPITFHQAVVNGDKHVPPSISRLTKELMTLSDRYPKCVRLSFHANVLDETEGYLTYISERYNSLPKQVLFFKGSFRDFPVYPRDKLLINITKSINRSQTIQYTSLPTLMRPSDLPRFLDFKRWMFDTFQLHLSIPRNFFQRAQFIVSRETVRKYPRSFYTNLLGHGLITHPPASLNHIHLDRRHGSIHERSWLQFAMEAGGWESLFQGAFSSSHCPFSRELCALYVVG